MKKILFFAAVTALAFTACTSDELTEQNAQQPTTENVGVGFDVYVPGATQSTRAGRTNVMTNITLQKTGFGIFGYQSDGEAADGTYATGDKPDYMWNQQVNYNSTATGWYYAPLKYWPNETKNDSQKAGMPTEPSGTNLDRLTFFAYAPWVKAKENDGEASIINEHVEATPATTYGITRITASTGELISDGSTTDAQIRYFCALDPNESVDLLWGVAPAGGLSYTNVSGSTTKVNEGMPLINLTKPAVNTNLKFTFQHALARLGVKVVLAADQVAPGGIFDYGNTKVTIEKIEIASKGFGTNGILNLKNTKANEANWTFKNNAWGTTGNDVLTIDATHGLAEHLRYNWDPENKTTKDYKSTYAQQPVTGVTTTLADAIQVSSKFDPSYPEDYGKIIATPAYSPTTPNFANGTNATTQTYAAYAPTTGAGFYSESSDSIYFHKYTIKGVTYSNEAYTEITPDFTYPTATVWENIFAVAKADVRNITTQSLADSYSGNNWVAYKVIGGTWTPTGKMPEIGDKVVKIEGTRGFIKSTLQTTASNYYQAKPNYFMLIPYNSDEHTMYVKVTYYVSTKDDNLENDIVYTKNVVEKAIELPHIKNGIAYNLKLILGLTSVKVEAEVADWVTTEGVVNLPQNTNE